MTTIIIFYVTRSAKIDQVEYKVHNKITKWYDNYYNILCDHVSKNRPSGHKLHIIIISWFLYNSYIYAL